jgi:two-component system sensor histidine kinase/response regulator
MQQRILLVDDEPRNLALLEALLKPLGHRLTRAADGRDAVALFERERPDLVLLDFVMPGFDGIDVLTHIRATEYGAHVPVVLVTAHTDREHRLRGLEAGADEFLEKPVDTAILLARVRTLLALKESRDELSRRHQALRQAQQETAELTAFVVHDLRSPLTVLCAELEWTAENLLPEQTELKDSLAEARASASRLRRMIDDLLTISRMEESRLPLKLEPLALAKVLHGVLQRYARAAAERGVTLLFDPDGPVEVRADQALLCRIVENLLDNALRYTPRDGRIAVGLRPEGGAEITVSNDGAPIPAAERARIFEKFKRGSADGASLGNAGLGLYFCKRAVEALGGAIDVTETPDWPTSFVITLPSPGQHP